MRLVFGLVLLVGLALAGFAVYMAKDRIGAYQAQLDKERAALAQIVPTRDVFVVTRPIGYGEVLTEKDVKPIRWPETSLPEGIFSTKEALFPENAPGPRIVLRKMETNEPLLVAKVTEPGEDAGVSSRLAKGMRAFAIKVDVSTGVSGFLRPGDNVDVYWTGRNYAAPETGDFTKLIQASIPIVAVDQIADNDRNNPTIARTVTVAISPSQVAALAQAQSTGRLSLALVGTGDDTTASEIEVNQKSLLGVVDAPMAAPQQRERVCTIKVNKGGEYVEKPIPCTN